MRLLRLRAAAESTSSLATLVAADRSASRTRHARSSSLAICAQNVAH